MLHCALLGSRSAAASPIGVRKLRGIEIDDPADPATR